MSSYKEEYLTIVIVAFALGIVFSQDYDYPMYSEDNMPETSFSCEDKIYGGYYADVETGCQMYHICKKDKFGLQSVKFLCGNGTVFDQRHLVCQDYRKVRYCHQSPKYYRTHAAVLARLRSDRRIQRLSDSVQFDAGRV